jgi:hypothetical protein
MTESDAFLQLIIMAGLVASMPFFWRTCQTMGKLIVVNFSPPKTISLEIKNLDGSIETREVDLSDSDELTKSLLISTKLILK